jgi:hypothetical protein
MFFSYRDAAVKGVARDAEYKAQEHRLVHDSRALLNKTHPLFRSTTCSRQCATIIVFMQLADNHRDFVVRHKPDFHEAVYLKLAQFLAQLRNHVGLTGNTCYCTHIYRMPVCHSVNKYIEHMRLLTERYNRLNHTLIPAFTLLYRRLSNDLALMIMEYVTPVPAFNPRLSRAQS